MNLVTLRLTNTSAEFSVRLADLGDSHVVWTWRNDEVSRKMSRNQSLIPWRVHSEWFLQTLTNPNRIIFIGMIQKKAVSAVRYDRLDTLSTCLEISISVAPEWRGRGLGQRSIVTSIPLVKDYFHLANCAIANIRLQNYASLNAFMNCGFREVNQIEPDFRRFEISI